MWVLTTIKHVDDGFLGHFQMLGSYQTLWDRPMVLVAYSFRGLVFKSLMIEAHKHVYKRQVNNLDVEVQKCCKTFLNNVKGVVFYGVPHARTWYPRSIKILFLAMSTNSHIQEVHNPI
jgi:hypothetical protein